MGRYDTVLIRYGELTTKGKNRKDFIRRLDQNIRRILKDFPDLKYRRTYDRIYIEMNDEDPQIIRERLQKVYGISSFSFTESVPSDLEAIKQACLQIAQEAEGQTFKVKARRHDKTFPLNSDGINRAVAAEILKNTDHKVDVHNPDFLIQIEVHADKTYLTSEKIPGAGGYPTGINGKCLVMLSGGIDSPVAVAQIMKRGIEVEAVHFASPPYTSENARQKVLDLASMLSVFQGRLKVHVVNFTDLQLAIYQHAGDPYAVTLMRRMMFRIAERIAKEQGCLVIGTGESVGQVASQTLESIACINAVVNTPILRPLACMDKVEIINMARHLGTYETSILPFEDCCTIFDPKNPVTKPTTEKAEKLEARFDWQTMVDACVRDRETITVSYEDEKQEDFL
ncbi:MAG: tRNA 4-thiouridine(8) synthase ThiI [Solobacterium sp.]|nr:tRNA 4-thiouridine(8) synthase ThiI [Solobacterium sp.]MBR3127298.1 tRNA 4-thiouridine(8) synthase ThiI [Solobacterium sp.]